MANRAFTVICKYAMTQYSTTAQRSRPNQQGSNRKCECSIYRQPKITGIWEPARPWEQMANTIFMNFQWKPCRLVDQCLSERCTTALFDDIGVESICADPEDYTNRNTCGDLKKSAHKLPVNTEQHDFSMANHQDQPVAATDFPMCAQPFGNSAASSCSSGFCLAH